VKLVSNVMLGLTTLACLAALAASVYPGALGDLLFMAIVLSFFVGPIAGITLVVVWIVLARRHKLPSGPWPLRKIAIGVAIILATLALLVFYVPRRIVFAISRPSFEPLIQNAPVSQCHGVPLNRHLGVYNADEYAADPRGGVYFRVHTGPDGIGPDQMSYGFAHEPNPHGSPFGAASYRVYPLSRNWYWFCASDDWY
jgi:hypothetical protein